MDDSFRRGGKNYPKNAGSLDVSSSSVSSVREPMEKISVNNG